MNTTSASINFDFSIIERFIMVRLQENVWTIIFIILLLLFWVVMKFVLQTEIKGACPYCGNEFLLNKRHHDNMCIICKKEFRLRNMKIYKGEDTLPELLYNIVRAFACLTVMSRNITDIQQKHVENFGISQNITRQQFADMNKIYINTIKKAQRNRFFYRSVVDKLKLYVEDVYFDRQMFEIKSCEDNILNILYNFAMLDGEISLEEQSFFSYYKKIFKIDDDRFNLVVSYSYESYGTSENSYNKGSNENTNQQNFNSGYGYNTQQQNTQETRHTAYNTNNQEYYKVLECDSNISDEELKKQYKKLMMQYHPDKYASNDLPEEIQKMLNSKMSELNEAYEQIKKERGIS